MKPEEQVLGLESDYIMATISNVDGKILVKGELPSREYGNTILRGFEHQFDNDISARIYMDQEKLEGSSPECAGEYAARTLGLYARALDEIIYRRFQEVIMDTARYLPNSKIFLMKNSTDWNDRWYGCHLNIRIPTDNIPEHSMIRYLIPFCATSVYWTGQGGIMPYKGPDQQKKIRFANSQRAHGIRTLTNMSATANNTRPFIMVRDLKSDGKCDMDGWGRLQITCFDNIHSDYITYVRAGVLLLIVRLLAQNGFPDTFPHVSPKWDSDRVFAFITEYRALALDTNLTAGITLADGNTYPALAVQRRYLEILNESEKLLELTEEDRRILTAFEEILDALEEDPYKLAAVSELWFLRSLAERYLTREGATWETAHEVMVRRGEARISLSSALFAMQHQAQAFGPKWGLWHRALAEGSLVSLHTHDEIMEATKKPPSSRAEFRAWAFAHAKERGVSLRLRADMWHEFIANGFGDAFKAPDPTGASNQEYKIAFDTFCNRFISRR